MRRCLSIAIIGALLSCAKPPTEKEAKAIADNRIHEFISERYHDVGKNLKHELKSTIFNKDMWSFSYRVKTQERVIDIVVIIDNKRNAEISIDENLTK